MRCPPHGEIFLSLFLKASYIYAEQEIQAGSKENAEYKKGGLTMVCMICFVNAVAQFLMFFPF